MLMFICFHFQLLLKVGKTPVDIRDNDNSTSLHSATQNGRTEVVETLVRRYSWQSCNVVTT